MSIYLFENEYLQKWKSDGQNQFEDFLASYMIFRMERKMDLFYSLSRTNHVDQNESECPSKTLTKSYDLEKNSKNIRWETTSYWHYTTKVLLKLKPKENLTMVYASALFDCKQLERILIKDRQELKKYLIQMEFGILNKAICPSC